MDYLIGGSISANSFLNGQLEMKIQINYKDLDNKQKISKHTGSVMEIKIIFRSEKKNNYFTEAWNTINSLCFV